MVRRKPYLSIVADIDKRTNEKPYNGRLGSIVVENPTVEGPDATAKTVHVNRSLRDDPLGRMHARRQVKPHQYEAGRKLQELFEVAEPRNARAMDFSKTTTAGVGSGMVGANDAQMRAYDELKRARVALGVSSYALVRDVLAERRFIEDVAAEKGLTHPQDIRSVSFMFRAALDDAAELFGFKGQAPDRRQLRDKYSKMATKAAA